MTEGIRAPNLPLGTSLGEFIGHEIVGSTKSLKRFSRASVLGSIEAITNSFSVGGGVIFSTLAQAQANLAYDAYKMAWVIQDATPANNGVYQKTGASGSGSWARLGDLPYSFYRAVNAGAGTANAIQATNGYPMANDDALIVVNISDTNTASPVTLSLNGGTSLTIKTASGNNPEIGGLVAGMLVAGYIDQGGTQFRMLSDQASAAIQSAAENAAATAVAASNVATGAMSVFEATVFSTLAVAEAYSPAMAPDYIRLEGRVVVGDGGQALYKKAVSEPSHSGKFSITLSDAVTVAWFEIVENTLCPEQFGAIGVDAAGDTAAYRAMVSVANARGGVVKVRMEGDVYLLNGTADGTTADAHSFSGQDSVWIKLGAETEVRQRTSLAKTFKFFDVDDVLVTGGRLIGFAQTQIDASQALTELDLDTSSGNAVAAIFTLGCSRVTCRRVKTQNHFGRDIHVRGALHVKISECELVGVGPTYNDVTGGAYPTYYPIAGAHQGNGEDAAIYVIPSDMSLAGTAWKQTLEVYNSSIKWHSFGVRTILNASIRIHGNVFDKTPGQYHIYDTESDDVSVIGNTFMGARMASTKWQFENRGGLEYGPAYDANATYAVGDIVRAFSTLYICKTSYSPGGAAFTSTNWDVHSRYRRNGYIFTGNIWADNGGASAAVVSNAAVGVNGLNLWNSGLIFTGNTVRNSGAGELLRLERCVNATVTGNTLVNGGYGILGRYFSGTISDNDIRLTTNSAILLSIADDTVFDNNRYWDCGLGGTADDSKAPVSIVALDSSDPPSRKTNPIVSINRNGWLYTGGESGTSTPLDSTGNYYLIDTDTRNYWRIDTTYGSGARAKKFRIDGSVLSRRLLHFRAGFANAAQNKPLWTITAPVTNRTLSSGSSTTAVLQALQTLIHEDMYADDLTNAP